MAAFATGSLLSDDLKPASGGNVEINLRLLPSGPIVELSPENGPDLTDSTSVSTLNSLPVQKDPNSGLSTETGATSSSTLPANRLPVKPVRVLELTLDGQPPPERSDKSAGKLDLESQDCPGGSVPDDNEIGGPLPLQPDDVPLVQEEHPFDVPAARVTNPEKRLTDSLRAENADELFSSDAWDQYQRIETLLSYYREHPENVVRRGPWAMMHAILPFGVETEVIAGNRRVNAIGWLCHNGVAGRQRMFQSTRTGFRPNTGPGVQGHEGQFLAILAQSHVQPDYPLKVGNRKYTIQDLVRYEQATCREKTELTFKLIAFSHYLPPNQTWRDNRGRVWSIEKLVAEELAQPVIGSACGGTHRLMGLSCGVIRRQQAGLPITGHFARAHQFLDEYISYTLSLQNPDGSFSTEWFERRANEPNVERKIQTTGHILEWLVYTLPDEHLRKPEIVRCVDFLLDNLGENPQNDWPIGPRGHSLRALSLYQQRALRDMQPARGIAMELSDSPKMR